VKKGGGNTLMLAVNHYPGHFGQLEVKERVGTEFKLVWQWSQPTSWIIGSYERTSAALPAGSYIAQYWAHTGRRHRPFAGHTSTWATPPTSPPPEQWARRCRADE
jgi:hypothetical protein